MDLKLEKAQKWIHELKNKNGQPLDPSRNSHKAEPLHDPSLGQFEIHFAHRVGFRRSWCMEFGFENTQRISPFFQPRRDNCRSILIRRRKSRLKLGSEYCSNSAKKTRTSKLSTTLPLQSHSFVIVPNRRPKFVMVRVFGYTRTCSTVLPDSEVA